MGRFLLLDEVSSDTIRDVHAYWDRLRAGRRFPAKRDIDPSAIKSALPYVLIAEVQREPLRVRYRLVGTEAAHFAGEDFTGKYLHETGWGEDAEAIALYYVHMFQTGGPVYGVDYFTQVSDRQRKPFEWAILPLAADGETIDHCLLVEDYGPLDRFEAPRR